MVNSNEGREVGGLKAAAEVSSDGVKIYGAFNSSALEAEAAGSQ